MDEKGSRRKSRRRSVRFMKSSDDKENLASEVYGSVWLAESHRHQSPSHSHEVQSDCPNESQRLQSDCVNRGGKLRHDKQGRSDNLQSCCGSDAGKIHAHCCSENDKFCGNDSGKFQSPVYGESEKTLFHLRENSNKAHVISQERLRDRPQSQCYTDIEKQQSSFLCDGDRVQSPEELAEGNCHQFIQGGVNEKAQSPSFRFYEESEEIHTPHGDESEKMQTLHPSFVAENDSLMVFHQPAGREESQTDGPGGHYDSVRLHSLCDQIQDPDQSERPSFQLSGSSESDSSKMEPQCYRENTQSWFLDHATPETMRSAPAVLLPWDLSLKETALCVSDVASDTSQTFHGDSTQQEKNLSCTTPVGNESGCGMDSETSLDKGFCQNEEPSFVLEKSSETSSEDAIKLQREDSVISPSGMDSPIPVRIVVDDAVCSSASKFPSFGNMMSPFFYTPVNVRKSQGISDASCSGSVSTLVAASVCGSAEKPDSVMITASACPVTTAVASVQRQSIGGFWCTAVGRMKTGDSDADDGVEAAENSEVLTDGSVVEGTAHPLVLPDRAEGDSSGTQPVFDPNGAQPVFYSNGTQPVFMGTDNADQISVGISAFDSSSVAAESFLSAGLCSESQENDAVTPSFADAGVQLAGCKDTGGSDAFISMPAETETIRDSTNSYQTLVTHSAGTSHDLFHHDRVHLTLPQHSPSPFLGSTPQGKEESRDEQGDKESRDKQSDKESKDSKRKKKNRRRSAFGAELRLGMLVQQGTADTSVPALHPEQHDSAHPVCDEANKMHLLSELVHEMCSSLKDDQAAAGNDNADIGKWSHHECPTKEDCTDVGKWSHHECPTKEDCTDVGKWSHHECPTKEDCTDIGKSSHGELPTKEAPTLPVRSRRKRRSADLSIGVTGSADSQDSGTDSDRSLFRKRRSSLRLYRQQCQHSSAVATTVEDQEPSMGDPVAEAVNADLPSSQQEGPSSSCEGSESSDRDTVPPHLEQLYRNKDYKKPADKVWETIFEKPSKGREVSKQKLKRYIQFEDHVPLPKLKRRLKKAAQNGWNIHAVTNTADRAEVVKKLQELDEELAYMDS